MSRAHPVIQEARKERQRQGMSQAELARRAGYSDRAIRSMEAGQYSPRFDMVVTVAQVLEIGLDELVRRARNG